MKKQLLLLLMAIFAMSLGAKEIIDFSKVDGFAYGKPMNLGPWEWKEVSLSVGSFKINKEANTADDS